MSAAAAFKVGHAAAGDWRAAAGRCLDQIGAGAGDTLGLVYATDALAGRLGDIVAWLRERTGIATWTGATGHGILAGDTDYIGAPALAVMCAALPADAIAPIDAALPPGMPFGIVHGDSRSPDLEHCIARASGGGFLVGGLVLPDGARVGAPAQAGAPLTGLACAAAVPVATGLTQGCIPIGPAHEVTLCDAHLVAELDGRPALEVFLDEAGEILSRSRAGGAGEVFAALPVAGSDTGDYLVRNIFGIDPGAGVVAVAAELTHGERMMFCRRDRASAVEDLARMLARLKARLTAPARGALYVSCLARGPHLFGPGAVEAKAIQDAIGPLPLVGFYANGEICHDRVYTHTGVLTLFL
ncbi:MAG TPA: FIST C-terminal domain-containing protein [Alphaproteobacteria bacterium]